MSVPHSLPVKVKMPKKVRPKKRPRSNDKNYMASDREDDLAWLSYVPFPFLFLVDCYRSSVILKLLAGTAFTQRWYHQDNGHRAGSEPIRHWVGGLILARIVMYAIDNRMQYCTIHKRTYNSILQSSESETEPHKCNLLPKPNKPAVFRETRDKKWSTLWKRRNQKRLVPISFFLEKQTKPKHPDYNAVVWMKPPRVKSRPRHHAIRHAKKQKQTGAMLSRKMHTWNKQAVQNAMCK